MKTRFTLLLALLLLALLPFAHAEEDATLLSAAQTYMRTQLFYSAEEADTFRIQVLDEDELFTEVLAWPGAHPNWVYRLLLENEDTSVYSGTTAFIAGGDLDREILLRKVINHMIGIGWPKKWNRTAAALVLKRVDAGYIPTTRLQSDTLDAARFLKELIVSVCGDQVLWQLPMTEWYTELLSTYGLADPPSVAEETLVWQPRAGINRTWTTFQTQAPEVIQVLLTDFRLADFTLECGALQIMDDTGSSMDALLSVVKDGQRHLIFAQRVPASTVWELIDYGTTPLLQELPLTIGLRSSPISGQLEFRLSYARSETEAEVFDIAISGGHFPSGMNVVLKGWYRRDAASGIGLAFTPAEGYEPARLRIYDGYGLADTRILPGQRTTLLDLVGAEMPTQAEAYDTFQYRPIPDGCAITNGVNLRTRPTTHSDAIAEIEAGIPVRVLETTETDGYTWVKVECGLLTGWVSAVYLKEWENADVPDRPGDAAEDFPCFAVTTRETAIRAGTGLFASTVVRLPAGTQVRVAATHNTWYYVWVPDGEMPLSLPGTGGTWGWTKDISVTVNPYPR